MNFYRISRLNIFHNSSFFFIRKLSSKSSNTTFYRRSDICKAVSQFTPISSFNIYCNGRILKNTVNYFIIYLLNSSVCCNCRTRLRNLSAFNFICKLAAYIFYLRGYNRNFLINCFNNICNRISTLSSTIIHNLINILISRIQLAVDQINFIHKHLFNISSLSGHRCILSFVLASETLKLIRICISTLYHLFNFFISISVLICELFKKSLIIIGLKNSFYSRIVINLICFHIIIYECFVFRRVCKNFLD